MQSVVMALRNEMSARGSALAKKKHAPRRKVLGHRATSVVLLIMYILLSNMWLRT